MVERVETVEAKWTPKFLRGVGAPAKQIGLHPLHSLHS
jgi:hypothetical protein